MKGVVNTRMEMVRRRMEVRPEQADGGRKEVVEEQEGKAAWFKPDSGTILGWHVYQPTLTREGLQMGDFC